jgi:CheY-like chemotaxis protein
MDDLDLTGYYVLLAEDEHVVAKTLTRLLQIWGAAVIGPASTLDKALALAATHNDIDAAIVDIDLRGEKAFPLADRLLARGVLLIFATGYDSVILPERYRCVTTLEKPYAPHDLARILRPLMTGEQLRQKQTAKRLSRNP